MSVFFKLFKLEREYLNGLSLNSQILQTYNAHITCYIIEAKLTI